MNKIFNFQFSIFNKIKFLLQKSKAVIVTGKGRACAKEAIFQVLKQHFKIGKEILIFESELKNSTGVEKFSFLVKNSPLTILVVTHIGDIPPEQDFFSGNKEEVAEIQKIAKFLPAQGYLILNFDDETVRELKNFTNVNTITFGFQERADIRASDIKIDSGPARNGYAKCVAGGTNFKINYNGNIVPVWLENALDKEQIYASLSAVAVGIILGLNLVEISQALRDYRGGIDRQR